MSSLEDDRPVYPDSDSTTKLVNLQHFDDDEIDVYIGGKNTMYNFDASEHANPFKVSDYGRRSAIAHYEVYFYKKYLDNPEYRKKVHALYGKTLGGWGYPRHCHGEVIVDFLEQWKENDKRGLLDYINERVNSLKGKRLGMEGLRLRDEVNELLDDEYEKLESEE